MECVIKPDDVYIFLSLFKSFHHISENVTWIISADSIYSQNIDPNQISMCDFTIKPEWFQSYNYTHKDEQFEINIKSEILGKVICTYEKGQIITMKYTDNQDTLIITFKGENNTKTFKIPLQEIQHNIVEITNDPHDIIICLDVKEFNTYCSQLSYFGKYITIRCTKDIIELNASELYGNVDISIPIDKLKSFEISPDMEHDQYIHKYDHKYLSTILAFQHISSHVRMYLHHKKPLQMEYMPSPNFQLRFFLAPQIVDE